MCLPLSGQARLARRDLFLSLPEVVTERDCTPCEHGETKAGGKGSWITPTSAPGLTCLAFAGPRSFGPLSIVAL